jgi:hypothetical protein
VSHYYWENASSRDVTSNKKKIVTITGIDDGSKKIVTGGSRSDLRLS